MTRRSGQLVRRWRREACKSFAPGFDSRPPSIHPRPLAHVAVAVAVANGGSPTAGQGLSFICDGYLVGISVSVETAVATNLEDMNCLKMAVAVDGATQLFLSGQGGTGYVSFAQLQMKHDLGLSDAAYGLGVSLFFLGRISLEVPNTVADRPFISSGPKKHAPVQAFDEFIKCVSILEADRAPV